MLHTIPLGIVSSTAAAYLIEQSLLFNDGDSAYLNRTPSVAGNRKTATLSVWTKRSDVSATNNVIMSAYDGTANNRFEVFFHTSFAIRVVFTVGGVNYVWTGDTQFRDASAWGHVVVAIDTTATSGNRLKVYFNGIQLTGSWGTEVPLNTDLMINSTNTHAVGVREYGSGLDNFFDGLMALPQLVDGAALAPTAFGETDDDGFWNPIEYVPSTISDPGGVTYVSNASSTANATGYTFSGQAIGTANANRQVIVGTSAQRSAGSPQATPTVTIGGVSATEVVGKASTDALYAALFVANVPSGTTADIVVTWPQSSNSCDIGVWAINTANFYVRDIISSNASPGTDTLTNMSGDGFVVAYCGWTTASADVTWVGATENFDISNAESANASGASSSITSDSDLTITATYSATNSNRAMVAFAVGSYNGIGKNGFQLDFADTSDFGKNALVEDTSTTTPSASGQWTVGTANVTFTGDDYVFNAGDDAMYSANTFAVADWPMRYVVTMDSAGTLDNGSYAVGLFDNAEIGTFNHQGSGGAGGMGGMTKSWGVTPRTGVLTYGGATQATVGALGNSGVAEFVIEADGTVRFYLDNVLKHEFTQKADGITVRFAAASSNSGLDYVDAYWQTGMPLFYRSIGFTTSDQLEDSPTSSSDDGIGNFAVWDAGRSYLGNFALEEGNTKIVATAQDFGVPANIGVTSGKWYWEITALQLYCYFGIVSEASMGDTSDGSVAQFDGYGGEVYIYGRAGMKVSKSASQTAYGDSFTTNDVIGVAFDADNGTIWFSKNGTWQNSATTGEITAGTTTNAAYSSIDMSDYWYPHAHLGYTGDFCIANFGQSPFDYTPPTGYVALATQNLPDTHPLYTGTAAQYRAGAQVQSIALTGNSGGNTGYTFRSQIPASAVATHSFTKVRVKMEASTAGDIDIDAIYIDAKATSGNAWDYQGTQVALTLNGDAAFNIPTGGSVWSDWVELSDNGADGFVVGFDIGASNGDLRYTPSGSGYSWHILASTDAAATTAPAGLSTTSSYCALVTAIEVQ